MRYINVKIERYGISYPSNCFIKPIQKVGVAAKTVGLTSLTSSIKCSKPPDENTILPPFWRKKREKERKKKKKKKKR